MKSISPFKFFTAVGFLIVSMSAGSSWSAAPVKVEEKKSGNVETKESCQDDCEGVDNSSACTQHKDKPVDETACLSKIVNTCKLRCKNKPTQASLDKKESDDKSAAKELKADCNTATKEYNTAVKDARGACESFEKVSGGEKNSCQNRINSCRKKIGSAVAGDEFPDEKETADKEKKGGDDLFGTLFGIAQQKLGGDDPNKQTSPNSSPSCVNYKSKEDRKEKKNDAKDLVKEMQRIKEKIADEKKKITEENAKLREKNSDIDVEIQKVDEAVKKAIRSVDEKKGERLRKSNEDLEKSAIEIRNLNAIIVNEKEKAESKKFEYAQEMLKFSEDKINAQCETEIEKAKQCFIKASKSPATDPKDPCYGVAFSGKGAKGTAVLKAKVLEVRKVCFEMANSTLTKAKFEQSKSLRQIQKTIEEKLNQIQDANNAIERKKNDSININAESDKERTDEEKSAETQKNNLTQKLSKLGESAKEAVSHSNDKIAEFQKELNDLTAKQLAVKMGILEPEELDNSLSDAEGLIGEREGARQNAISVCCPELAISSDKSYTNKEIKDFNKKNSKCGSLIRGGINQADGGGRSGAPSSETKQ